MDPNSAHQLWSRWRATVKPAVTQPSYAIVKENCARFYKKAFGSVTGLKITARADAWTIDCRTEGKPAHDPVWVAYMSDQLRAFFLSGFGPGTEVTIDMTIEAGDTGNGKPRDQVIVGPAPVVLLNRLLKD